MNEGFPKHALVTGAARRIGRAIATALAQDGWTVGIHHASSQAEADILAKELANSGHQAYPIAADLSDDPQAGSLVEKAVELGGPVSCLVNNASIFERDSVETVSRDSWDRHMDVNLWAPVRLSQAFAAALPDRMTGNIINIVDQRVVSIPPDFLSYTISKSGLWSATQGLSLALAPRIRVNAIGPGPVLPSPRQSQKQFDRQAERMPLGHGADPDEIARGVLFVLSTPSMTGQMVALDGGQHLGWDFPDPDAPPIEE